MKGLRHLRILGFAGACLASGVVALAAAPAAPWPGQRGGPEGTACREWTGDQPIEEWHYRALGKGVYEKGVTVWASPALAVVNNHPVVFIGGCDRTMHALDLATKTRLWFKITNGNILDAPAVGIVGGRPAVFWGSADRFVYAHDAADGARLWSRELTGITSTQGAAEVMAPLFQEGVLYVAFFVHDKALKTNRQEARLCALDASDGRVLWSRLVGSGPVTAPVGRLIGGRFVLFLAARKGLLQTFAVSRDGAVPLWTFQMPHEVLGSPALEPDGDSPGLFLGSKFGDLIAIDAQTGRKRWHRMTGNWVDNNACVARVGDENVVFAGSYDRSVYALRASDGSVLWRRRLGAEVFSAPCVFEVDGRQRVAVACLDNHLVALDAATGEIRTCYYVGEPQWDRISKGDTLWGSPVALQVGKTAMLIHGSYDGAVYMVPARQSALEVTPWRAERLVWGMVIVLVLFAGVALPVLRRLDRGQGGRLP